MKKKPTIERYPLSSLQQGMLFHHLSEHEPGVDIEQIYCTLPENLEPEAFHVAWLRVIERHEIFRTTFHWEEGVEPWQEVLPQTAMEFKDVDWRGIPVAEQEHAFDTVLQSERRRGFNLSREPPLRLILFHLSDSASRFLWTFHHLLLDGRATVLALNEVFAIYEAAILGEEMQLPPPRRYREYIDWLQQQDWSAAEEFWRKSLKGFTAPTRLGVAFSPSNGAAPIYGEQEIRISESATVALKALARQHGFTTNTLLQGTWALLLSRYSREEDVVFGVIRACRGSTVADASAIIGMLINTVPLRLRVLPEMTLANWMLTVRHAWNELRDFEHTPLTKIQGWSVVRSGQPLFASIFNYQEPSWDAALQAQGGKWGERQWGLRSQSNYPLAVDAYGGDTLLIKILYHRNRFDDASISRMLGHYKTLLEGMAASPYERVGRLEMLTRDEREQLLTGWNNTSAEFPQDRSVLQMFEEQVQRTPDALAVSDSSKQWSYAELEQQANMLATELRANGVAPEACVGVCLERSAEMVAAKLAVWKSGGAYVPLDPSCPIERLKFMVEDAGISALLTQISLREPFENEMPNLKLICADGEAAESAQCSQSREDTDSVPRNENKNLVPNARSLAYVIYTSGSTGQPKGVEIEHRSLANLIAWHQRTYAVTSKDRATQVATPAFDASVWELWPYLTRGASIHIPDDETRISPARLVAWLAEKSITLTFIPTPVAEAMLQESWPGDCALRALLTGGDRLLHTPGRNLPCRLANHYGPTENTVVTTWTPIPPVESEFQPPPIGRPIANTRVYVLDPHLQLVPIGVAGELHIGGVGLARGYRNQPLLTESKFIPNPVPGAPDARVYKTGDLVRWRADGQLEFLGRLDDQVKIRGQRIELGEIECALGRHSSVREASVAARENGKGEKALVAYVVWKKDTDWSPATLRRFLQRQLSEAMVPSAFVRLEALPLTANGKVDRAALPKPETGGDSGPPTIQPHTPTELKLAEIWCEVLGVESVGRHDNFFELGGHSLTATQVGSRLGRAFNVELPLRELFDTPVLAELAEKIEAAQGVSVDS